jgi:hypothetical protein
MGQQRKKKDKEKVKSKYVPIRFSPALLNSVDKLVWITGTNRSDVIRRLIPDLSQGKEIKGCTT